jgi:acyl-CoA synthetase (AMP-forming)/AMP-acid ligase II/3-hydroxymyristoyl/3-hydroxydecanoyl-(acyl carrier protein) dehydratase
VQSVKRLALYTDDRIAFTHTLFNAWAEGVQVFLPGDDLPATRTALAPHIDGWLTPERKPLPNLDTIDRALDGVVVFTSGSTGAPIAIHKALHQLFDEIRTLDATFSSRLTPNTRFISSVSHQHIYGLLFTVLWPTLTGRQLAEGRLEYPEEFERDLAAHDSVLIASPAHLKRLPTGRAWNTKARAVFSSGGPLSPEASTLSQHVIGHTPIEVFGSSETGGIAWRQGSASPWAPLTGISVRASDANTLEVKSPHLPDGNWFTTADRVEFNGDTFRLLGRADRIAKIEEKRVSLDLLEHTFLATGLLKEAKVVVLPGARVTLGLVGVPANQIARKDLIDQLKAAVHEVVEPVARPRRFRFPEALPVNAQGKTPEALLTALFAPDRPDVAWAVKAPTRAELTMKISPDLRVLAGHFPEVSVVAGVAQIDWAIFWGREAFPMTGVFTRMEALKFQSLMLVGHDVKLTLEWNAERKSLSFKYVSGERVYSSGRVVFA